MGINSVVNKLFFASRTAPTDTTKSGVSSESIFDNTLKNSESTADEDIKVVVDNLEIPWEIAFIDDKTLLVTERPGNVLKVNLNGEKPFVQKIEGVLHRGEGGLLGIALHPNFSSNKYVYLYFTTQQRNKVENTVERYTLTDTALTDKKVILQGINGSSNHDGGRMAFGPDGYLYITTGDAEQPYEAQNKDSLSGKILRIKDDGTIPADNPFGNAVYSWGHRNPQGINWDQNGKLWATEHGPSGSETGHDELNLIVKGNNYGWPVIRGTQTNQNMVTPIINSGTKDTWAPGQVVFYKDSLFFVGLRGSALYQAKVSNDKVVEFKQHFKSEYGRLRTIVIGPDQYFYITTNNTDGRGTPKDKDDKIIRINPEIFY